MSNSIRDGVVELFDPASESPHSLLLPEHDESIMHHRHPERRDLKAIVALKKSMHTHVPPQVFFISVRKVI